MSKVLSALERRFGRWAIPNLIWYIVGTSALVWVMETGRPGFVHRLEFDPAKVVQGEVWRIVTFIFIPPASDPIFILLCLYFQWLVGSNLEARWGTFRFNVFYLLGMVGTIVAAGILLKSLSNIYLGASMFLAFATLFPDFELLVLFLFPVKMKWLGILTGVGLAGSVIGGSLAEGVAVLVAVGNYLLFCGRDLLSLLGRIRLRLRSARRRQLFMEPPPRVRRCAVCGKTDEDRSVDIRVCSCAKCGKPTDYCVEHARNHG